MKFKFSKLVGIVIPVLTFSLIVTPVFAVSTSTNITLILDPIIRLLNLISGLAAFVFLAMIFYTAYKYAIAQGDPKMLQGAKDTLTHAIFGFIIAAGSWSVISWFANALGINAGGVLGDPSGASQGALQELIDFISL